MMRQLSTLMVRSRKAASRTMWPHGSRRAQGRAPHHEGRNFIYNTSGNAAILFAVALTIAMACAALAVDAGSIYTDRRKAQSAADLAAIAAAADIGNAGKAAASTLAVNHMPATATVAVETGTYTATSSVAPSSRFAAAPLASANAVRVTLQTQTPLFFGKMIAGQSAFDIRTSATASTSALATFAIGSRLASLNGGVVNGVLGGLLGASLSLSAVDYDALAKAQVDLFDVLNALAARTGTTGGNYNALLSGNFKLTDIIGAMKAVSGSGAATNALNAIAQALSGSTAKVPASSLVALGPYASMPLGDRPRVSVQAAVLDLVSAAASANGNQATAAINAGLPGIAGVSLQVAIGERPEGTSWIKVGATGASVHTAQTRVLLNIQLLGAGAIASVNLPLYVEVASGSATLTALACGSPTVTASTATLGVTPGVVDAWIGNVSAADMKNFTAKPNPPAANLVSVAGVAVTGRAHAGVANSTATPVTFSYADIQAQTRKTVTTTSFAGSLTATLLGDLSLGILGLPMPGIGAGVTGIIAGASGSIDQIIAATLAALGVGVGQADVWVTGIRCDGAVLVN